MVTFDVGAVDDGNPAEGPVEVDWTAEEPVDVVVVQAGGGSDPEQVIQLDSATEGTVTTERGISFLAFCVVPPTPTETPTPTPTETPTPTPTETPQGETVYWQVDFDPGATPPDPPDYAGNGRDLMAALGNSDDGVTNNHSLLRQDDPGELGDVTIVGRSFSFDDENAPTEVTVEFEVDEGAPERDLHLAVFVLPGPYDYSEVDQQELYASTSVTVEGGDRTELKLSIPQESTEWTTAAGPRSAPSRVMVTAVDP